MRIKKFFYIPILCMGILSSCLDDEILDLKNFPINQPEILVQGSNDDNNIVATYLSDGTLKLDAPLTRTYVFRFKASPEDMTVNFEPICSNIPAEKVILSTSEVLLAAGETDAVVTVSLKDDDFNFAATTLEEETYVLGVKANVNGFNIGGEPMESKIMIEKEAYSVAVSLHGENQNSASFERTFVDGSIEEQDPIAYKFKVMLDKPANKDVAIQIFTEGIAEKYLENVTIIPNKIVIPAGQTSSEEVTWAITNDFLLEDAMPATFLINLKLGIETEDATVKKEGENSISITVKKKMLNMGVVDNLPQEWSMINKEDCSVFDLLNFSGNGSVLFDSVIDASLYCASWYLPASFVIDMKNLHVLKGIKIDCKSYSSDMQGIKNIKVYTSKDKIQWVEQADLMNLPNRNENLLEFYTGMETRYVKLEFFAIYSYSLNVAEMSLYE